MCLKNKNEKIIVLISNIFLDFFELVNLLNTKKKILFFQVFKICNKLTLIYKIYFQCTFLFFYFTRIEIRTKTLKKVKQKLHRLNKKFSLVIKLLYNFY